MKFKEILAEYQDRAEKLYKHPGLAKMVDSAMKHHGITSSYELDILLTMFLMRNVLPSLDSIAEDFEQVAAELTKEKGYAEEPTLEDIVRKMVSERFSEVEKAAKTAVSRLFGELDGDPEVDEYMRFRATEILTSNMATTNYLLALDRKRKENDGP